MSHHAQMAPYYLCPCRCTEEQGLGDVQSSPGGIKTSVLRENHVFQPALGLWKTHRASAFFCGTGGWVELFIGTPGIWD